MAQYTYIPATARCQIDPTRLWDDDTVLRTFLANEFKPNTKMWDENPIDPELWRTRAKLFKIRARALKNMCSLIAPRKSFEIDDELGKALFKHKVSSWRAFRFNDLPEDIFIQIFHEVIAGTKGSVEGVRRRLVLTWVCTLWRDVAIRDKVSWSWIWFRGPGPWERSMTFLERAGSAPLDIRIDERDRKEGDTFPVITAQDMDAIMAMLVPKFSQIRNFLIIVNDRAPTLLAMQHLRHAAADSLERFEVHRIGNPYMWEQDADMGAPIPLCGGHLPRLNWICLGGMGIDWHRLPAWRLRALDLRRVGQLHAPSRQRWVDILDESRETLFKLSLEATGPQPEHPRWLRRVRLDVLRDLTLSNIRLEFVTAALSFIDAPYLRNLTLTSMKGEDYSMLLSQLRMFPEIRSLTMNAVTIGATREGKRKVMNYLESIKKLRFLRVSEGTQILLGGLLEDPLEYPNDNRVQVQPKEDNNDLRVVCPELKYMFYSLEDPNRLVQLVRGRSLLQYPFAKVYVPDALFKRLPEETIEALRSWAGEFCAAPSTIMWMMPEEEEIYKEMAMTVPPQSRCEPYWSI